MSDIKICNLSLEINKIQILKNLNFESSCGKILGIIGESGSGKSMTANSITQLLPNGSKISGEIILHQKNLLELSEKEMCNIRGREIGFIFQEPMTALNPLKNIGDQVAEGIKLHFRVNRQESLRLAAEVLRRVDLPQEKFPLTRFPFELSGGQRQRVIIAMAISTKPKLIIADEPSTALDVTTQSKLLKLLKALVEEDNVCLIIITHDLAVISELATDIIIMKEGEIVESGNIKILAKGLRNKYSQKLFKSSIYRPKSIKKNKTYKPLLEVKNVSREYIQNSPGLFKKRSVFKAVSDISFTVNSGENLGLVGESGCGKSTLTRVILGLDPISKGEIILDGTKISLGEVSRKSRKKMQVVFQDPYGSFNPRHKVGKLISEPLYLLDKALTEIETDILVLDILKDVGLNKEDKNKYIHEFSGGQRQRIAIARSLIIKPKLIILDEAVSALDVSIRAQILDLLVDLSKKFGLSYLFISHDLSLVKSFTDRIIVMKSGKIVEYGKTLDIFKSPKNEYTKSLIAATPNLDRAIKKLLKD